MPKSEDNLRTVQFAENLGSVNRTLEEKTSLSSAAQIAYSSQMFQKHPRHLYTWISSASRTRNQIDYVMFSHKWKSNIRNVRTRPGADCNSDHQLLTADIRIRMKKMERPLPPVRLYYDLADSDCKVAVENNFETPLQCEEDKNPEELWNEAKEIFISTLKEKIIKKKNEKAIGSRTRPCWQ